MEAIVLAGGFGKRLRTAVPDLPKPMAPVAGKPFLEILLRLLKRKGFKHIVFSLGYKADQIVNHFGSEYCGIKISYEIEEMPLGTGGATRVALRRCSQDHVYVFNGDTFLDLELKDVELLWQKSRIPIIVSRMVPDTSRYGRLLVTKNRINSFVEKGVAGPGLINAGCCVLPINSLDKFEFGKKFSLENDFLVPYVASAHILTYVSLGCFIDIGTPEDYAKSNQLLMDYD